MDGKRNGTLSIEKQEITIHKHTRNHVLIYTIVWIDRGKERQRSFVLVLSVQ